MINRILNLFKSRRIHHCMSGSRYTVYAKAKYVYTGKIMKGRMALRYDVYRTNFCAICNKRMDTYKIHKNVKSGFLLTRYNIHV